MSDNDEQVLSWEQTHKLHSILSDIKIIHGRRNFPSIEICTKDFIRNIHQLLIKNNVTINYIRINGGAASHVIADGNRYEYTDIDIIFGCLLIDDTNNDYFDIIKETVFHYLISLLPTNLKKDKISTCNIKEAYINKFLKVYDKTDIWSLISLNNEFGQNIELKFVHKMKRQFQFSVDSFQIDLESLLQYYNFQDSSHNRQELKTQEMNENFYPSVNAFSVYGSFKEAKYHLDNRIIATKTPEEMRGGGLLKYCNLLIRGFKPLNSNESNMIQERYMCSRFFIDFKDINSQQLTLGTYLHTHFFNDPGLQLSYLIKLHEIVKRSTVCLMNHERQMTLTLIQSFIEFFKNVINNLYHQHYQYIQQIQYQQFYHQQQQQQQQQHQEFLDNSVIISNESDLKRPNTLENLSRSSASPSLILSSNSSSICCSPVNTTNIPFNHQTPIKEDNFFRGYIPQNANLGIEILDGCCPPYLNVNNYTNDDTNS